MSTPQAPVAHVAFYPQGHTAFEAHIPGPHPTQTCARPHCPSGWEPAAFCILGISDCTCSGAQHASSRARPAFLVPVTRSLRYIRRPRGPHHTPLWVPTAFFSDDCVPGPLGFTQPSVSSPQTARTLRNTPGCGSAPQVMSHAHNLFLPHRKFFLGTHRLKPPAKVPQRCTGISVYTLSPLKIHTLFCARSHTTSGTHSRLCPHCKCP